MTRPFCVTNCTQSVDTTAPRDCKLTFSSWSNAFAHRMLRHRNTVEVFDGTKRVWSRAAPMTCKRSAVGATVLNDRLYVCGGYDGITSLNTVECYDPDRDAWTSVAPMNKHRHVYGLGGHDGLSIFDSVERLDPQTGVWLTTTPMLSKRLDKLNVPVHVPG